MADLGVWWRDWVANGPVGVVGLALAVVAWTTWRFVRRLPAQASADDLARSVLAVESEQLRRTGPTRLDPLFTVEPGGAADGPRRRDIGRLYEGLHQRRLLILGEPGTGKTTVARSLVVSLLRRRTQGDEPVPVLLGLSSWDPASQEIEAWFVSRVAGRYGIRPAHVRELVLRGRILPVLDGLDELPPAQRGAAERVLPRWLSGFPGSVVTCRSAEYPETSRLSLGTAVELLPLGPDDVTRHLSEADAQRWRPVIQAIGDDPDGSVAQALSSPWLLSLATQGYAGDSSRNPAELTTLPDALAVQQRILDTADTIANIEGWGTVGRDNLAFLTDAMGRESDGLLLWWRMAENYGSRRGPWYASAVLLAVAALVSLAAARDAGARFLVPYATVVGIVLSYGGAAPLPARIRASAPRGLAVGVLTWQLSQVSGLVPSIHVFSASNLADLGSAVVLGAFLLSRPNAVPVRGGRAGDLRTDLLAGLTASGAAALLVLSQLLFQPDRYRPPWGVPAILATAVFAATLLSTTAWARFRIAHLALVVDGALPPRLGRLLRQAEEHGLLTAADGYGSGCYAFRHELVRETLLAYGPDRRAYVDTTKRCWREIQEEVLGLPESVAYVARTADTSSPTTAPETERIARLVDQVRTAKLRDVADRGFDAYQVYRKARERMSAAVRMPWWAGPVPTRAYAAAALTAGAVAFGAIHVMVGTGLGALVLEAFLGIGGLITYVGFADVRIARQRPGSRLPFLCRSAGTVALYLAAPWALAPFVPRRPAMVSALVAAPLTVLLLILWLYARPHPARARAALDDVPAAWPDLPELRNLREAALQARQSWLNAVARQGVMPEIRDQLAVGTGVGTEPPLPGIDPSRLTGSRRSDQFLNTDAADEIEYHLRSLESASIGISGQRGAGKSSLMQRFCTRGPLSAADDLLVLVPAPTSYDPREFLIHMFAEVCRSITGEDSADDGRPGRDATRRRALALHAGAAATALAGVLLLLGTLLWPHLTSATRALAGHVRVLLITGSAVLIAAGVVWALLLSLRATGPGLRRGSAEALAAQHLRALHYQLTVTRGRTAQLALPGGLQVSDAGQTQHTRQVLTHPELVAQFRAFLDVVARERNPRRQVVIGIDELDKLGSPQEAERFLNDLKAVFGVRGCHFLVAVSEDALTTFGRQVLDVRTAFDSALDRVVAVRPLTLEQARRLLELRGVWLPDPYLWLCQVLSGGLPRELLRAVTSLATERALRGTVDMRALTRKLIEDDARSVLSAQSRYAATLTGAGGPAAARWIADVSQAPVTADEWEVLVSAAPPDVPGDFAGTRAVSQVRAYLALGATLLRTFTEGDVSLYLDWLRTAGPDPVDRLATARAMLATDPEASWSAVTRYRSETPGLAPVPT
ncbi:NACHT domain-containing protein [Streptomyces sp. 7R007]